jgi:hypothetical protein
MSTFPLPLRESDIDTRGKRRRVCSLIAQEVDRIRAAEEDYMNEIPDNLRSGSMYMYARKAEEDLFDAMILIHEAFVPF